jgi:hypothetical protein
MVTFIDTESNYIEEPKALPEEANEKSFEGIESTRSFPLNKQQPPIPIGNSIPR